MSGLTPAVLLGAAVFAILNTLKFLRAKDWNAAATQVAVWVVGGLLAWIGAQSTLVGSYAPTGVALSKLNGADLFFIGLQVGSLSSVFNEAKKALDNKDNAKTPALFTPTTSSVVEPTDANVRG